MKETVGVAALGKVYGTTEALKNVTLSLEGPQLIGILGPNGAGKTTFFDILAGVGKPTSGTVRLFGAPSEPYPRRRVGVVMQREFALDRVTVLEYAELFAAIQGVPGGEMRIVERAKLGPRARVPVERLSGGEAQRLFIAAAIVHDPELVLLDEPTAHLDPESKQTIGEQLEEMSRTSTVLMATHDLSEADTLCDYLVFLVDGQVRAHGTRQSLVEAVPDDKRKMGGIHDAFFHFCSIRIAADGGAP
jgi:ABC-2 type transport system ATP-binding protein